MILTGNTQHIRYTFYRKLAIAIALLFISLSIFFFTPRTTHAAFVPTIDQFLETAFPDYVTNHFDRYWQDMIAILLGNPNSITNILNGNLIEEDYLATCPDGNENNPYAVFYTGINYNNPPDPPQDQILFYLPDVGTTMPNPVQINTGSSVRCLLQELIEWKKLEVNMTIHALVKEYFSDSASFILSKRLANANTAAHIESANSGLEQKIGEDGVGNDIFVTGSTYVADRQTQKLLLANNEVDGLLGEIENDGSIVEIADPQVCEPFRTPVRNNVELSTISDTTDMQDAISVYTACELDRVVTNEDEILNFYDNMTTSDLTVPPWQALVASNLQNAVTYTSQFIRRARDAVSEVFADEEAYISEAGGNIPTRSPADDDPYARKRIVNEPGFMHRDFTANASFSGNRAIDATDEQGEEVTDAAASLQYDTASTLGGLRDYDTAPLTLINQYPDLREGYDALDGVIDVAYFGIDQRTRDWARNAVLNIWDDVQFHANLEDPLQVIWDAEQL